MGKWLAVAVVALLGLALGHGARAATGLELAEAPSASASLASAPSAAASPAGAGPASVPSKSTRVSVPKIFLGILLAKILGTVLALGLIAMVRRVWRLVRRGS